MYIYILHIQHPPGEQGVGGPEIRAGEAQPGADRSATCPAEAPGGPDVTFGNVGNVGNLGNGEHTMGKGGEKYSRSVGFMMMYHVFHGFYQILQFVWWVLPFCSIFLIVFLLGWLESCFSKWTDVTMNISTVSTVNVEHSYSIMFIVPIYLF